MLAIKEMSKAPLGWSLASQSPSRAPADLLLHAVVYSTIGI